MANWATKVRPGDKLKLPAATVNNAIDAARAERAGRFDRDRPPAAISLYDPTTVRILNGTNSDLAAGAAVRLGIPIVLPEESLDEWQQKPSFTGEIPASTTDDIAILAEPIPAGEIGRGIVSGEAQTQVEVIDEAHRFAVPKPGTIAHLQSAASGIPMPYKQPGIGVKFASVLLPGSKGGAASEGSGWVWTGDGFIDLIQLPGAGGSDTFTNIVIFGPNISFGDVSQTYVTTINFYGGDATNITSVTFNEYVNVTFNNYVVFTPIVAPANPQLGWFWIDVTLGPVVWWDNVGAAVGLFLTCLPAVFASQPNEGLFPVDRIKFHVGYFNCFPDPNPANPTTYCVRMDEVTEEIKLRDTGKLKITDTGTLKIEPTGKLVLDPDPLEPTGTTGQVKLDLVPDTYGQLKIQVEDTGGSGSHWVVAADSRIGKYGELDEAKVLIGNASNEPQDRTISQDLQLAADGAATVKGIRTQPIKNAVASAGQMLIYNGTNGRWEQVAIAGDLVIDESGVATVEGMQGRDVQNVAPGQAGFLIWDNDAARWEPHTVSGDVVIDKDGNATVERIRGIEVHYAGGPNDQDVLTYDAGANAWVPQAPAGGGGGGGAVHSATHLTGVTGGSYSTVFDHTDTNGLVGAFYLYNADVIDIQYKLSVEDMDGITGASADLTLSAGTRASGSFLCPQATLPIAWYAPVKRFKLEVRDYEPPGGAFWSCWVTRVV